MKKGVLVLIILLFLAVNFISLAQAGNVTQAYQCLNDKVHGKCADLTLEENIFSLLAIGECKAEVVAEAQNAECWPSGNCNLKTTAQAILALDKTTFDTDKAADWLLAQKKTPSGITWFLQVESNEATSCSVEFEGGTYTFNLNIDKKISSGSGDCFTPAQDNYWLKISDSCLDKEFQVSCSQSFLTNLIFQKQDSDIFFISETTSTAQSGGHTLEKINSFCFTQGSDCDYEGGLWAALTLTYLGRYNDVKSFLPYLITNLEGNEEFLPESFLYYITDQSEYRTQLLSKQKFNKYWEASPGNNRFYDTAVALFSLSGENPTQKQNTKTWLLENGVQGSNGCWESNIINTAFILHTAWPEQTPGLCDDGVCDECKYDNDCEDGKICSDGECIIPAECSSDNECLPGQTCSLAGICQGESSSCDENIDCGPGAVCLANSCIRGGSDCINDNECADGEICDDDVCVEENECEDADYFCRNSYSCELDGGEILTEYECPVASRCCSIDKPTKTCSELGGDLCSSGEVCQGGTKDYSASDIQGSGFCCVGTGATCATSASTSDCTYYGGSCKASCSTGEDEKSYSCPVSTNKCCIVPDEPTPPNPKGNLTWIWILLALIVLSLLGILFRQKLRMFFSRFKSGPRKRPFGPPGPGPRFPPSGTMGIPIRRPVPRRILPSPSRPQPRPSPQPPPRRPTPPAQRKTEPPKKSEKKDDSELDEVLKKLKDIGK